jgi:hypothetical protein
MSLCSLYEHNLLLLLLPHHLVGHPAPFGMYMSRNEIRGLILVHTSPSSIRNFKFQPRPGQTSPRCASNSPRIGARTTSDHSLGQQHTTTGPLLSMRRPYLKGAPLFHTHSQFTLISRSTVTRGHICFWLEAIISFLLAIYDPVVMNALFMSNGAGLVLVPVHPSEASPG